MPTDAKKRPFTLIILVVLMSPLFACQLTSPKQPLASKTNALYQQLLNLPVPSEIEPLEMTPNSAEAGAWTEAYFSYVASPAYFELLSKHTDFAQTNGLNAAISLTPCTSPQMPDDFSYWTERPIVREGKQCYIGVYFPYIHYLIYSPETQKVDHFVTGMRE